MQKKKEFIRSIRLSGQKSLLPLSLLLLITGCEAFSYVASAVAPEKRKAVFTLADVPTLVLVDDPGTKLGNPALPGAIAARIGFELKQAKALTEVVDPQKLAAYRAKHGRQFARLPVDQVGRDLQAQQVLHVWITAAAMSRPAPALLQGRVEAQVKVIDVVGGRLFPAPSPGIADAPGHGAAVGEERRTEEDDASADAALLARDLSEELGVEVAKLFYESKLE